MKNCHILSIKKFLMYILYNYLYILSTIYLENLIDNILIVATFNFYKMKISIPELQVIKHFSSSKLMYPEQ